MIISADISKQDLKYIEWLAGKFHKSRYSILKGLISEKIQETVKKFPMD